jgi:hypothetical protein
MVVSRTCNARNEVGDPCRAAPLIDGEFCFAHSPEHAAEMQEARRMGGLRRRRERTVAGAYDVEPLDTVAGIRRVLEIVTFDGLGMEISIARGRLLVSTMQVAARLLETGELERRVDELEAIIKPRNEAAKGRRR